MDKNLLTQWLLASPTATIRYKTMLELLELPENHESVVAAYNEIQQSGAVPAILNQQVEIGKWKYPKHYYTPKFTSTHWSMVLLEELQCSPNEPRYQAACDFMLSITQKDIEKYKNTGFTCLWGNIIRYCLYGGWSDDSRLQLMIELTAESLQKGKCSCEWNWKMPCVWGAARSIWGLLLIPETKRSKLIEAALQTGFEFVLENANLIIQKKSSRFEKKTHQNWSKLSFPNFYHADILFILRLLKEFDQINHPQAPHLITWLKSKQKTNGRWQGSSPFRQRTYPEMGGPEETSRWITLQAASILKKAG